MAWPSPEKREFSELGITMTNLPQAVSKDVRGYPTLVARTKDLQAI
jgi:hypothetical protein